METSLTGKALDFGSKEYGFESRVSKIKYNSYAYVVNHLNLAMSRKQLSIKIKYTKKTITLVKALYTIGYISNYVITKNNKIVDTKTKLDSYSTYITLSVVYFKNTSFFKSLRLVSTPSRRHTITLRGLQLVTLSIKSSVIVLSTPHGIIDHREAIRLKTGGLILCMAS